MNHTRHDYLQAMDDSLVAQDIDIDVVFCEWVDCPNEAATYVGESFDCLKHGDLERMGLFDVDRISEGTFLVRPQGASPPIGKSLIDISTVVHEFSKHWECSIHGKLKKDLNLAATKDELLPHDMLTPCIHIQVSEINRGE